MPKKSLADSNNNRLDDIQNGRIITNPTILSCSSVSIN